MREWDTEKNNAIDLDPTQVTGGSRSRAHWICTAYFDHKWVSSLSNRTTRNSGCPYCTNRKILVGFNDFASKHPQLMREWDVIKNDAMSLDPTQISSGSGKRAYWVCMKYPEHRWIAKINSRTGRNRGCPYCANKQVLVGYNDFATKYPMLIPEWDTEKNSVIGLDPTQTTAHSNKHAYWICSSNPNHQWVSQISHRTSLGSGCPKCSHTISQISTSIFDVIHTKFNNVREHRISCSKYKNGDYFRVDCYIPDLNIVIEYDGEYWHSRDESVQIDLQKTQAMLEKGFKVLRLRETTSSSVLAPLDLQHVNLKQVPVKYFKPTQHVRMKKVIEIVLEAIHSLT